MPAEPTVKFLLDRFHDEIQSVAYPLFILLILDRNGSATRKEIKDEIFRLSGGSFEFSDAAHKRLIGRLEKTFRLIEPTESGKKADLKLFRLTPKGKRMYANSLHRVVYPLQDILCGD